MANNPFRTSPWARDFAVTTRIGSMSRTGHQISQAPHRSFSPPPELSRPDRASCSRQRGRPVPTGAGNPVPCPQGKHLFVHLGFDTNNKRQFGMFLWCTSDAVIIYMWFAIELQAEGDAHILNVSNSIVNKSWKSAR